MAEGGGGGVGVTSWLFITVVEDNREQNQLALKQHGPAKLCATKKLSLLLLPIIRSVNYFSVGRWGGGRRVRVGGHHRFPSEMTSDKRALRFHTDDA